MKILYAVLLMMVCVGNVFGQKEESIWMSWFLTGINFSSGAPVPFTRSQSAFIWRSNAAICDSDGNLLFFTNGFRIFDKNLNIMQNGDSLDIGDFLQSGLDAMPTPNGSLIIPVPGQSHKYYVFYTDLSFINDTKNGVTYTPTKLEYSIVNMSLNNGVGKVEKDQKNISILNDTLTETGIEAVKHGDGSNWWLFCHKYNSNRYYRFFIDNNGIHGPYKQEIGYSVISQNEIYNILRFSQDGNKAIQNYTDSTLFVYYDFDRCSGLLSNPRVVHVSDTLYYLMGLSFSPSGRYAYLSANYWHYLFQFDLQAQDIEASKTLIAIYDGATNPFQTDFFDHALGLDGKIYICTFDDNNSLHVINDPDSAGKKCNFVENGFSLLPNTYWNGGVPQFA